MSAPAIATPGLHVRGDCPCGWYHAPHSDVPGAPLLPPLSRDSLDTLEFALRHCIAGLRCEVECNYTPLSRPDDQAQLDWCEEQIRSVGQLYNTLFQRPRKKARSA
jgi:hypothetical protein